MLKSGGYTKHYYIEGQRIVSKLGGGMGDQGTSKAGHGSVGYAGKHQNLIDGIVRNLKFLGEDGSILTAGKSGKVPPGQIKGGGMGSGGSEKFQYFYRPDHLEDGALIKCPVGIFSDGPACRGGYITDASGEVYQHLEYFAFGGTFVEEHSNTDRVPYLFNGKELDEETGLYYYAARYYDAQTSIFPSVDPLAEKYPMMSPYAYASNNPLKFIDPTGMEGEGVTDPPTHKIQKGETLTIIAKQHGTTVNELQNLNNIKDPDKILAGSTLNLPTSSLPAKNGRNNVSTTDIALAGVGTSAMVGEILTARIKMSRSGFTSGKISPKSPRVYSKATATKMNFGAKGIGWGLTIWSIYSTEQQFESGSINASRRIYNHLNNGVGVFFPITAIPIAIGDYYGQTYADEIVNDVTQPSGHLFESTKFMLESLGIPTSPNNSK